MQAACLFICVPGSDCLAFIGCVSIALGVPIAPRLYLSVYVHVCPYVFIFSWLSCVAISQAVFWTCVLFQYTVCLYLCACICVCLSLFVFRCGPAWPVLHAFLAWQSDYPTEYVFPCNTDRQRQAEIYTQTHTETDTQRLLLIYRIWSRLLTSGSPSMHTLKI